MKRFFSKAKKDTKDTSSPYLTARRTWNEQVGSIVTAKQTWQVIALLSMISTLASVGGLITLSTQSKYIPYVIAVDNLGRVYSMGRAIPSSRADPKIIKATVAKFIENFRQVTADIALERKAIMDLYAHLPRGSAAINKMNKLMNEEEHNPLSRAKTVTVDVQISSVLQQSKNSWEVEWTETSYDREGIRKNSEKMRGIINVALENVETASEQQILNNPLGIYVKDFSWAKVN